MFYIALPILLFISFLGALYSLRQELKNTKKRRKFYELRNDEEVIISH